MLRRTLAVVHATRMCDTIIISCSAKIGDESADLAVAVNDNRFSVTVHFFDQEAIVCRDELSEARG